MLLASLVVADALLLLASPTVVAVNATAGISSYASISAGSTDLLLLELAKSDLNFLVFASTLSVSGDPELRDRDDIPLLMEGNK
jgi:hypothetical protein